VHCCQSRQNIGNGLATAGMMLREGAIVATNKYSAPIALRSPNTADAQEPTTINPNDVGRYQILTIANDTFLIDTAGGFVWRLTQYSEFNREPLAWAPMFRLDRPSDTSPLLTEYGLKPR